QPRHPRLLPAREIAILPPTLQTGTTIAIDPKRSERMMRRRLNVAVFLLTLLSAPVATSRCDAQGFAAHLEPPPLQRGKTTRVTVVGSTLGKALDLWTSLPAGAVKATPVGTQTATRAVLDVTVAADAPVGVCGARLATADGLGNACMLLIDDLPV